MGCNCMQTAENLGIVNLDEMFDLESLLDGVTPPFPVPTTYRVALTEYVDLSARPTPIMVHALTGFAARR